MAARGFTLIEVLVALTVLSAGLLAAAGGGVVAARLVAGGQRDTRLSAAAGAVLADLAAAPCEALSGGRRTVPPVEFTWSVSRIGARAEIRLTAVVSTPRGVTRWRFLTARWCGP